MRAAAAKKSALVNALVACVEGRYRREIKRFLQGLATDELQYIAEFLGSCILENSGRCHRNRTQLAEAIKQFERNRRGLTNSGDALQDQDQEHKMILLLEYLCRSGLAQYAMGVGAGQS